MKPAAGGASRRALKAIGQPASACLAVERFAEPLTPAERNHVAGCARCQTEAALWESVNDPAPRPGEGAAVQWIVSELKRRRQGVSATAPAAGIGRWLSSRAVAALGAALAAVVIIGYLTSDREPAISPSGAAQPAYRSAAVQVRAPLGDQSQAPRELEWLAVPGASIYEISVFEVDRTVLWRGSAADTRIALPPAVAAVLVPGKTLLWEVVARDSSGRDMAASGLQTFRIVAP